MARIMVAASALWVVRVGGMPRDGLPPLNLGATEAVTLFRRGHAAAAARADGRRGRIAGGVFWRPCGIYAYCAPQSARQDAVDAIYRGGLRLATSRRFAPRRVWRRGWSIGGTRYC